MKQRVLFDFADPEAANGWRTINDDVMGGVSESQFVAHDGRCLFTGHVSLENDGGFATARSPNGTHDLGAFDGLQLRVKGDGKRYKLTVYTEAADRASYRLPFQPAAGQWQTCPFAFDALEARFRGQPAEQAPPFDPTCISNIGFLISDKQAGPFRLELAWIRASLL